MKVLPIPKPISGGIFLSYKCNSACRHCMYACSPRWSADWISEKALEKILTQLAPSIQGSLSGPDRIGINYGLHFTGGEPFLNFTLLLKATKLAQELGIPSTFVETNCFWCKDEQITREKLQQLKNAGLNGILISVNPFILEEIPFERTRRAIQIAQEIFGKNVIIYQDTFYRIFEILKLQTNLLFENYLELAADSLQYVELIPMGRVPYTLGDLFQKYPAKHFFGCSCREELTRAWHIHVDNYGNYISGYCGGISLGNAENLAQLLEGIELENHPILNAIVTDLQNLYEIAVNNFEYEEVAQGYISKCHLCVDIRRHITQCTKEFQELSPREFYQHLK